MSSQPAKLPDDLNEPEILSKVDTIRHSCAHIMAHAVQRLWPDAEFGIGPTVENGFYYDLKMKHVLTPEDLAKIESEMRKLVGANQPFVRSEHSISEARAFFEKAQQPFKVEIIDTLASQGATSV